MPAISTTTGFDILLKGSAEPISLYIKDPKTEDLVDVVGSANTWSLIKVSDDSVVDSGTFGPTGSTDITHVSTGIYQYTFDSSVYNDPTGYILSLRCTLTSESVTYQMFLKSVSAKHFKYAAYLRSHIDKACKSVADDIENMDTSSNQPAVRLYYGYTDAFLIFAIERGLQIINAVSPYTSMTPDNFPFDSYGNILIDASTIAALESQGLFAIDTDYDYSLGGNSLIIDHYSKLNNFITTLFARFDRALITFKQQFRTKGLVMFQFMPGGVRSARMLQAMGSFWWSRLLANI